MNCLIHPTYFPNVAHVTIMVKSDVVYFEVCDNYQKQSHRNRTEIYGANGKLALTVPVSYTQKNRQLYKDVKIANEDNWQQQHIKSLQSAYSMSPFFEFYIDDLMPLFENRFDYILDFNLHCFEVLLHMLQLNIISKPTLCFEKEPIDKIDYRQLVKRNFEVNTLQPYTQVFTEKHGFISNLSILDLIFNEGPNTELYLKKQTL
ncbi:WbqC family protein [Winogradskyella echinorum]|uniref:WbqC family protein n=1 Tax=Winogradskyella echinorum TaxID=538189 RepID=A0ABR6Y3T2_9FLAO|nr:WbqC family protein [Winogradskyella echinorum]MBC3846905.1 WbqC family protein [Winogradskyella echinorum]MBC5751253.1 WbqC family protein [Winogradskyella echinorum]